MSLFEAASCPMLFSYCVLIRYFHRSHICILLRTECRSTGPGSGPTHTLHSVVLYLLYVWGLGGWQLKKRPLNLLTRLVFIVLDTVYILWNVCITLAPILRLTILVIVRQKT
jgi:hypothetical protein